MIRYEDLENHFILPSRVVAPFYGEISIPRKLKKKVKKFCWVHWDGLTNGQRLWYYMEKKCPDYKRFLIKQMCKG